MSSYSAGEYAMSTARRPLRRALFSCIFAILFCLPLFAADKPRIEVNDYQIDAELVPRTHRLVARAVVTFNRLCMAPPTAVSGETGGRTSARS